MSSTVPTTLRAGPSTTNTIASNKFTLIYGLIVWLTLIPCFFVSTYLLSIFKLNLFYILVVLPIYIFVMYFFLFFFSIMWSWLILKIVNFIHPPREGIFPRDPKDKDYKFWSLRAVIKKFPIWVCHNFGPFPWTDVFAFKVFGNKITYKSPVFDAWVDSEFLDVGRGTTIGQGSIVMTSMITVDYLIIKGVSIGKNSVIGGHSVVSPGTKIGDNTILGALSATTIDQSLESNWVYLGNPAKKMQKSRYRIDDDLSAHERAIEKKYEEIKATIPHDPELKHKIGAKARYQIQKSEIKEKWATYHQEKALLKQAKAENKARKAEIKIEKLEHKADKHRLKAMQQKSEALEALEKARENLIKKLEQTNHEILKIKMEGH